MSAKLAPNLKILVVDDMESIRQMVKANLKTIGLQNIVEAVDGQDAFEKVVAEKRSDAPFELVISDINMPRCNGIELLKKIKGSDDLKSVPVLMVSTVNEQDVILKAISEGASNYILKPFDQDILREKLLAIFYPKK